MDTRSSCEKMEPLIKLDENGASAIINYHIAQTHHLGIVNFIRVDIDSQHFSQEAKAKPTYNFWDNISSIPDDEMLDIINGTRLTNIKALNKLAQSTYLNRCVFDPTTGVQKLDYPQSEHESEIEEEFYTNSYIAWKIKQGYKPVITKRLSGKKRLRFKKDPIEPLPQLVIVFQLGMVSIPSAFGAGQVIKSFSLLPGEKTTISIKTYEKDEATRKNTENIIDSYSESSSNEFQETVESSTNNTWTTEKTESETDVDEFEGHFAPEAEVSIAGKFTVKFRGVDASAGSNNETTESFNAIHEEAINHLRSSVNKQVHNSNYERKVEINTEYTFSSGEGSEQAITREIENINKSRVLNFIFRQLVQEYTSITYLKDVTFIFTNGYPENTRSCAVSGLSQLLDHLLTKPETSDALKNHVFRQLCNIKDYQGDTHGFIELVEEEFANCIKPEDKGEPYVYVRKKNLQQTHEETNTTVDGIILDVTKRTMHTPAVIAEAILGQGEALDCYNMQLQEATFTSAQLENEKVRQMIDLINGITDPAERAKMYKKVFGNCCDVPQSCCCTPKTEP